MRNENGFVLAIVVVFAVLLFIVLGAVSSLTRTDLQVTFNKRNAAQALAAAEAGVAEALARLEMKSPTLVTVNGRTFDATIKPDKLDPAWTGLIQFASFDPTKTGSKFRTPTIVANNQQLPYSNALDDGETLRLAWAVDALGKIRTPRGAPLLQITSVGREGAARRRVTVDVSMRFAPSLVVLEDRPGICKTMNTQGNAVVGVYAGIAINSPCSDALAHCNGCSLTAGDDITITGNVSGTGSISPKPLTSQPPVPDPFATLPVPKLQDYPVQNGTPGQPKKLTVNKPTVLQPGVYYGGIEIMGNIVVQFTPGMYIMGGGGFSMSGDVTAIPSIVGGGITIYNTASNPNNPTNFGDVKFTGVGNLNLVAPATGPWAGVLLFQDRNNPEEIKMAGAGVSTMAWDGALYAKKANLKLTGNAKLLKGDVVINTIEASTNTTIGRPTLSFANAKPNVIGWIDY